MARHVALVAHRVVAALPRKMTRLLALPAEGLVGAVRHLVAGETTVMAGRRGRAFGAHVAVSLAVQAQAIKTTVNTPAPTRHALHCGQPASTSGR